MSAAEFATTISKRKAQRPSLGQKSKPILFHSFCQLQAIITSRPNSFQPYTIRYFDNNTDYPHFVSLWTQQHRFTYFVFGITDEYIYLTIADILGSPQRVLYRQHSLCRTKCPSNSSMSRQTVQSMMPRLEDGSGVKLCATTGVDSG